MVFENFGLVMTFKCIMLEIVTSFDFQNIIFYTCLLRITTYNAGRNMFQILSIQCLAMKYFHLRTKLFMVLSQFASFAQLNCYGIHT